ncbi:MAG: aldehyde ferredoxin oxidoreductase family protein [Spirochaetales bacterium]|nr:aldehyde ferredoxin oxidoreductase family protein [Spirochaetales bacterium]
MNSLMGKLLYVDLTEGKFEEKKTPLEWIELYTGQKGLASRMMMEDVLPATDPFSPENRVVMSTAVMTGTIVSCSGKLAIATKSPQSGTISDGSVGGHAGAELKYAGFDAVSIGGKAEKLSILYISDKKVDLIPATELAGLGTFETESRVKEIIGDDKVKVLAIGPAGENLVLYSCISSERYRQLGRGGIAAVMGSKNLKAIAIRGGLDVHVPDIKKCMDLAMEMHTKDEVISSDNEIYDLGTTCLVDYSQESGLLPTRNFQEGTFEEYKNINGEAFKAVRQNKKACFSCGIACGNYVVEGRSRVEGPEYETIALGGSSIGNGSRADLIEFNARCDDLGLDTISSGGTIAYMMEATEKGIYDFGIRFGEMEKVFDFLEKIAFRKGIGEEAAEGSRRLAAKYGGEEFAIQVKGLELPGYDPRGSWSMGIAYVTAPRGGCHMSSYPIAEEAWGELDPFTFDGKAKLVADMQNAQFAKFSMGVCDFWPIESDTLAKLFAATYGGDWNADKVDKSGERVFNLQRVYNVMAGFSRTEDKLPGRFHNELLKAGPPKGKAYTKEAFEKVLDEYFEYRGWDKAGRPKIEKLTQLGIEEDIIQAYSLYINC